MSQPTQTPVKAEKLSNRTRALLEANGTRPGPDEHEIWDANNNLFAIAPDGERAAIIALAVNSQAELLAAARRVRSVLNGERKEILTKAQMEQLLFEAIANAEPRP